MKYLVFSDIHGSKGSAKFIVDKVEERNIDKCLFLGDYLYHGPRNDLPEDYSPKDVIPLLNSIKDKVIAVRGNCDSEVDQMVLDFPIMEDKYVFDLGDKKVVMTHGHLNMELDNVDVILSGHTHIPCADKEKGVIVLNPGSLTIPKGGFEKSYGILTEKEFIIISKNEEILMQIEF